MRGYWIGAALVAGFAVTLASSLSAQQRQSAPDSNLNAEDQLSPSQMAQPMPGAVATPGGAPGHAPAKHTATAGSPAAAATRSNAAIAACCRDDSNTDGCLGSPAPNEPAGRNSLR